MSDIPETTYHNIDASFGKEVTAEIAYNDGDYELAYRLLKQDCKQLESEIEQYKRKLRLANPRTVIEECAQICESVAESSWVANAQHLHPEKVAALCATAVRRKSHTTYSVFSSPLPYEKVEITDIVAPNDKRVYKPYGKRQKKLRNG